MLILSSCEGARTKERFTFERRVRFARASFTQDVSRVEVLLLVPISATTRFCALCDSHFVLAGANGVAILGTTASPLLRPCASEVFTRESSTGLPGAFIRCPVGANEGTLLPVFGEGGPDACGNAGTGLSTAAASSTHARELSYSNPRCSECEVRTTVGGTTGATGVGAAGASAGVSVVAGCGTCVAGCGICWAALEGTRRKELFPQRVKYEVVGPPSWDGTARVIDLFRTLPRTLPTVLRWKPPRQPPPRTWPRPQPLPRPRLCENPRPRPRMSSGHRVEAVCHSREVRYDKFVDIQKIEQ